MSEPDPRGQQPRAADAGALERRLQRERAARREAEAVAERATRELFETVQSLTASRAVLDETTDYVWIGDLEGSPFYLNRAMCELLGIELAERVNLNLIDVLSERSRSRYANEVLPTLHEKGLWRGELAWARPGGAEIAVSQVLVAHRRTDGLIESISSIARDISEQSALHEQLTRMALHDALTGLANRRLFFDQLDLAQARASRAGSTAAILFIDLDGFKAINDTCGHDAGDTVLVTVANRLRAHMRVHDTLARLGGDEFAVLCEELGDADTAIHIAERLAEAVSEPVDIGDRMVTVGASIGIALTAEASASLDGLLQQADDAMYQAKLAGVRWRLAD